MKKALKKTTNNTWYFLGSKKRIDGVPECITGDLSGIRGDLSDITGDLSDITGDLSGIRGDLSECEISDEERKNKINVEDLVDF